MGKEIKGWTISSFCLFYDGTYYVRFSFNEVPCELRIYLDPIELFKLLLREGYGVNNLPDPYEFQNGLKVNLSKLFIPVTDESQGMLTLASPRFNPDKMQNLVLFQCEISEKLK